MCIFSKPVVSVTDTNIFARLSEDDWQYLVYQMKFETEQVNAMILPIPIAEDSDEKSVEFISFEEYEPFFKELVKGFPRVERSDSPMRSRSGGLLDSKKLEVHKVGAFVASFVPSLEDFSRLDEQFVIPKESWDQIPIYSDYGFVVFQLAELKGKPHPMAFKFKTRHPKQVFVPTVHIHDGEVHAREAFDHSLYAQHPDFDEMCGGYKENDHLDSETGMVRSKWPAKEFCKIDATKGVVDGDLLVHRAEMKGMLENRDVLVNVAAPRQAASFQRQGSSSILRNPMLAGMSLIVGAGALGLAWLFNRRDEVQSGQKESQ